MERFSVDVDEAVLDDLRRRLDAVRWADDGPGGLSLASAQALAAHWRDGYDWRSAEAELNSFSQFTADGVHFIAEGDGPPLLLLHGWPSSVWEFHRLIPLAREFARVIVPSLPGYGFSALRRSGVPEMADAFHALMGSLGFPEYFVAGGDWGAHIGSRMAVTYPDAVRALHLNMMPLRRPAVWPSSERDAAATIEQWTAEEGGYAHIQGTKPQTLAYALFDSPVGLMAWIAEKFEAWTDAHGVPSDDVLTTTMIYWITGTIGTSFWPYYDRLHDGWLLDDVLAAGSRLRPPLTYLDFPHEIARPPRSWAEHIFDIERWDTHDYGGHFPALETTDVLADSLRRFVTR
jgi:pimeloyl-ACP methyl ester carboxylesterase